MLSKRHLSCHEKADEETYQQTPLWLLVLCFIIFSCLRKVYHLKTAELVSERPVYERIFTAVVQPKRDTLGGGRLKCLKVEVSGRSNAAVTPLSNVSKSH